MQVYSLGWHQGCASACQTLGSRPAQQVHSTACCHHEATSCQVISSNCTLVCICSRCEGVLSTTSLCRHVSAWKQHEPALYRQAMCGQVAAEHAKGGERSWRARQSLLPLLATGWCPFPPLQLTAWRSLAASCKQLFCTLRHPCCSGEPH